MTMFYSVEFYAIYASMATFFVGVIGSAIMYPMVTVYIGIGWLFLVVIHYGARPFIQENIKIRGKDKKYAPQIEKYLETGRLDKFVYKPNFFTNNHLLQLFQRFWTKSTSIAECPFKWKGEDYTTADGTKLRFHWGRHKKDK